MNIYRTCMRSVDLLKLGLKNVARQLCSDVYEFRIPFNNKNDLVISSSKYAGFADGAAIVRQGDTSVLVTVVGRSVPRSTSFVPLTVDYRQKAAAAGRIPTSHHRREKLPSEQEILVSRMIDRSLRPLFVSGSCFEVQVICNVLAVDGIHDPEVLCLNAASAALALSHIPWSGPVGAVRVALINEEIVVSPTRRDLSTSSLNMVVTAAPQNLVVMIEASADNVLQQDFQKAIKTGVKECQRVIHGIQEVVKTKGKSKVIIEPTETSNSDVTETVISFCETKLRDIFTNFTHDKLTRDDAVRELRAELLEKIKQDSADCYEAANEAFNTLTKNVFRNLILETNTRCDGRSLTELRKIITEVDLCKPLHGSSFFQRGQTQVLCTVSLDSLSSAIQLDRVQMLTSGLKEKNFFVHYEFPPYAVKEIGRVGPAVRREIGHGAVAEKGLKPVVPQGFPFTIRLTSEVLQSNGSSCMGTVCAGSMALMDAGVPLASPAAGVAIGLVTKYSGFDTKHIENYKILTDILGIEDYMGDMDFKIAGTKKGITALQADIKIPGLPLKIVMEAVQAGCEAKSQVIDIMNKTISKPRSDKKSSWPVTENLDVPIYKRGKFLGTGGINLKRLYVNSGVEVNFDEETGLYQLFAPNQGAMEEAKEVITNILTKETEPTLEFGGIYCAKIIEIRKTGVMVTLFPGMTPVLLHVSQLDNRKVNDAHVLGFEEGEEIPVKYFGLDPVSGQMRLSRKVLLGPASSTAKNLQKS